MGKIYDINAPGYRRNDTKRRVRRIEQRERRLKLQANHSIAKQIIEQHPHTLIGLEQLTDIRERARRRKRKRKKLSKEFPLKASSATQDSGWCPKK